MPSWRKKGDGDADLDSKKASLFGSRSKGSKSGSPAPSNNPYAVPQQSNDPYAARSSNPYANNGMNDPYAPKSQASLNSTQPPASSFGNLTLNSEYGQPPEYNRGPSPQPNRHEKSPVPPGGYGGAPRYGNTGNYGQSGGYDSNPYGGQQPQQRQGGYGGLGRTYSNDTTTTDAGRNALFGDAPKRAAEQQSSAPQYGGGDNSYANTGGYQASDSYGGYGAQQPDRELTAEEQEEQEVEASKSEIRFIKQQDVSSTRNARRIAEQAEQTGRETLARLGQQGERIHNAERNLDMATHQNRLAAEKASELKTLNRSMFAVHVANPFTANKREQAANAIALEKHRAEREMNDATSESAAAAQQRGMKLQRDVNGNPIRPAAQRNLADRAKYQFEADSEDDEMENEIEDNLDAIHRGATTMRRLGEAMGTEIESQNKHIEGVIKKTDKVDDGIAVNRARLDRIR